MLLLLLLLACTAAVAGASAAAPAAPRTSSSSTASRLLDVHPELRGVNTANLLPSVHGALNKTGPLAWAHWSQRRAEDRFDAFLAWRLNRSSGGGGGGGPESFTCAHADHPPLPYPGCHVFVNHRYKFIFVRAPKAASTAIVDALGECGNLATRGHNATTCMALHTSWEARFSPPSGGKDAAAMGPEAPPPRALAAMWRDYFVFSFVRNPWRRAHSLHKYLLSDGVMPLEARLRPECGGGALGGGDAAAAAAKLGWGDFCADPWGVADRAVERGCAARSRSYLYFHATDQLRCLVTAPLTGGGGGGGWAVDFLGRVERIGEDWPRVVAAINARRAPGLPPLPKLELQQRNVRRGVVPKPYGGAHAHCHDAVARWMACDVERLGYVRSKPAAPAEQTQQQTQTQQKQKQKQKQQKQTQQVVAPAQSGSLPMAMPL